MFVFKYENDSYGIPYLIATRFSPAGVNPFPVMAGLLTRPSRRAFPALHQWQVAATTDRFGVPLSPAPLRAVSVNAAKALMDIFPIRHKEENRLRIEGSDGNVIFNVIVPQNPVKDGEAET